MPKGKRGPALFELLEESGSRTGGVKVPSWWSRHAPVADLHAARAARAADDEPAIEVVPPSSGTRSAPRPFFEVEGDRVCVSLTSVTAAVVVFLGLATILAAYGWGARRGDRAGFRRGFESGRVDQANAADDEIVAVRNQPPASHLVGGLLEEAGGKATSRAGTREDRSAPKKATAPPPNAPAGVGSAGGWVRDLTYIVVQEFPAAAAEKVKNAREFLAQRGVNTELVALNNDTILLITTQGYNHKDPAQKRLADQLLEKVRTVGTQYYAAGGGYRLEGYFKTLKRDTW